MLLSQANSQLNRCLPLTPLFSKLSKTRLLSFKSIKESIGKQTIRLKLLFTTNSLGYYHDSLDGKGWKAWGTRAESYR